MDRFDCISPIDYRYWDEEVAKYLSEDAFTRYKLEVEKALATVLCMHELCSADIAGKIMIACEAVTTEEVYEEEGRIGHDIRALVNCIRRRVSDAAKPFVHMMATSFDIVDTANVARYRDVMKKVLIPRLRNLAAALIQVTNREADTLQIGRTHGQHAVPITFGFAIAGYVSRLGHCIKALENRVEELVGKFSGAVGAYNASKLFVDDPETFEMQVLEDLHLVPAEHSTQIVPPEPFMRLLNEVMMSAGIMAQIARNMRNLQRTEIGEVGEEFKEKQVGSSTMPQKRNPIGFENVEGMWKLTLPRLLTVFMDQLSDHERDLTGSVSGRTYGEIIAYTAYMAKRLTGLVKKLRVDPRNMARNFALTRDAIAAEPLQLILGALGHPNAHEAVRKLTLQAQEGQGTLIALAHRDPELSPYFARMKPEQIKILNDPTSYTGIAAQKARTIAASWEKKLDL